jgi:hypothetical protein
MNQGFLNIEFAGYTIHPLLPRACFLMFAIISGAFPVHASQSQSFVFAADSQSGSLTNQVEGGLELHLNPQTKLGLSFSSQFGNNVQDNAVQGNLTWRL